MNIRKKFNIFSGNAYWGQETLFAEKTRDIVPLIFTQWSIKKQKKYKKSKLKKQ
jgi:hypothetical protein